MKPDIIMIRLGEYMVKGRNRRQFENRIEQQINRVLLPFPKHIHEQSLWKAIHYTER